MPVKRTTPSLYLALLLLGIFTSTATAQTVAPKNTNTAKNLLAQTEETVTAPEAITFGPRIGASYTTEGSGFKPYGGFDAFFPIFQTPGSNLTFVEGKMLLDADTGALGGNILLGHRFLNGAKNRVTGGYVSYDSRNTGNAVFNQLGLGFESLGENVDFHVNGYIPVGNKSAQLAASFPGTASFQGSSLQIDRVRLLQESLTGADAEVGTKLTSWNNGGLRGYVGGYVYGGENISTFAGVRGRVVGTWDGLQAGLSLQNDSRFDTRLVFNIGASLGGNRSGGNQSVLARLADPVQRESSILVDNQIVNDSVTAILANGQQANIIHVASGGNSDGSFESPYGFDKLQTALNDAAKSSGIVYVRADNNNTTLPGFTVPSGVQVVSSAQTQQINTLQAGNIKLPGSGSGISPKVTGTVTLASNGSNQTLSGFAITNTAGQAGIVGTNNTNATISYNQVTIKGVNTDLVLAGRGIVLTGANGTTNINYNTVTNAIGEGIRLDNVSGKANITNNTVLNTIQPNTQTGLEASIFIRNNKGDVDLTITGNEVGNNNTQSTLGEDGKALVGNEIDGIEVSLCRSYGQNGVTSSDPFATCGVASPTGTATAKVNISDNKVHDIGNITPTVIDGADGIDINFGQKDIPTDTGARISSFIIDKNIVTNMADKGISFGIDSDSILKKGTISNNTITNVGGDAIAVHPRANSVSDVDVLYNTIDGAVRGPGDKGALVFGLTGGNANNAVSVGTVIGNTIKNTSNAADASTKSPVSGGLYIVSSGTGNLTLTAKDNVISNTDTTNNASGIYIQTQQNGKMQLVLDSNTVTDSKRDGITILAGSNAGTSQVNIVAKNNNLQGNNTAGSATKAGLAANAGSNTNFCLALQNNKASNNGAKDYILTKATVTGTVNPTFRIEDGLLSTNTGAFQIGTTAYTLGSALPTGFTSVPTGTCSVTLSK
jgi:trimeric autotransporter adhesin